MATKVSAVERRPVARTDSELPAVGRRGVEREDRRITPGQAKFSLAVADFLTVCLAIGAAFATQALFRPVPGFIVRQELLLAVVTLPLWLVAALWMHLYSARFIAQTREEIRRITQAVVVGSLLLLATGFAIHLPHLSRLWIGAVFVWVLVLYIGERLLARAVFRRLRREGRLVRRVAIVGTNDEALRLGHTFAEQPELGYEVMGYFAGDDDDPRVLSSMLLGTVHDAEAIVKRLGICGVVVAVTAVSAETTNRLVRRLTDAQVHVEISSSLRDIAVQRLRMQTHDGHPMVYLEPTVRSGWRAGAKRTFDIAFSAAALVLASPVLLVSAVLIKLDSRGPVFFRQERVGKDERPFKVLKLRTMTVDAEARKVELLASNEGAGPLFKMRNDPRVTRVGRVLRKFSIDEIPQFWNVIRGEMSVVGPRPALASEMAEWNPELRERLRVRPGITGSWQVSGRSDVSFEQYRRLDLYYVDNWSLAHDLAIVAKTVPAVIASRGAA